MRGVVAAWEDPLDADRIPMDDSCMMHQLTGHWKQLWHATDTDVSSAFKYWLTHHARVPDQQFAPEE
eukprot:8413730-Prorocentrum_lima.AAC.1